MFLVWCQNQRIFWLIWSSVSLNKIGACLSSNSYESWRSVVFIEICCSIICSRALTLISSRSPSSILVEELTWGLTRISPLAISEGWWKNFSSGWTIFSSGFSYSMGSTFGWWRGGLLINLLNFLVIIAISFLLSDSSDLLLSLSYLFLWFFLYALMHTQLMSHEWANELYQRHLI